MKPMKAAPQPIPYQGSKRLIAPRILEFIPSNVDTFFEPFAGSAAVTLAAAQKNMAAQYLISDVLKPLTSIWDSIISRPQDLSSGYELIWKDQIGNERAYFDQIRDEFNKDHDPCKLLYLIARCVKNSVRFNSQGQFNQSPDNRRLGMHPDTMRERIQYAHELLSGRTTVETSDFRQVLLEATSKDFVYMDPPYQGTSQKKDTRYAQQLDIETLSAELERLNSKSIKFALSYDGSLGDKTYGKELSSDLNLTRVLIHAGRSSQATLLGRKDETVESLYLSPSLIKQIGSVPSIVYSKAQNTKVQEDISI
nr:DNA adenine methylase [uncultured Bdellovibrio sp.]